MARKYEFIGDGCGACRRIRRLSDGALGGWIEHERNLSHDGSCWVSGDALVFGNARVYGNARVCGNARVYGDARIFGSARVFGNAQVYGNARVTQSIKMATRSDSYTFALFPCADNVWRLTAGCRFFTMDEAWRHWERTRAGTDLGEETFDILVMFEHHIARQGGK